MSRNPLLEAIHEARYDLQTCAEKDKPAAREKLYVLLQQAASRIHPPARTTFWTHCMRITKSSGV